MPGLEKPVLGAGRMTLALLQPPQASGKPFLRCHECGEAGGMLLLDSSSGYARCADGCGSRGRGSGKSSPTRELQQQLLDAAAEVGDISDDSGPRKRQKVGGIAWAHPRPSPRMETAPSPQVSPPAPKLCCDCGCTDSASWWVVRKDDGTAAAEGQLPCDGCNDKARETDEANVRGMAASSSDLWALPCPLPFLCRLALCVCGRPALEPTLGNGTDAFG